MAIIYDVFSHSIQKHYKTNLLSRGTLVQLICIVLTYLSPFLIAYFSNGFWLTNSQYTEQATIHYKYKYVLVIDTQSTIDNSYSFLISSSFQNINDVFFSHYRTSYQTIQEIDSNSDGLLDYLKLTAEIPLNADEKVLSVKLLVLFNFTLSAKSNLQIESCASIDTSNILSSGGLSASGSLVLKQNQYLQHRGFNDVYSASPINSTNFNLEDLSIDNILDSYYSRPFSTVFDADYIHWRTTQSNANTFQIKLKVKYDKKQLIQYIPGFWQQFKWGWIQYVSILVPFIYVFKMIKIFLFQNQLIPTIQVPLKEKIN